MTWLSLDSVLGVCVPSPFCVLDRNWNSIVVIHDHWIFICFEQKFDFLLSQYRMSLVIIKMYQLSYHLLLFIHEPQHDKTNKMTCAPSEDSDQPGHPPSLIRVLAVRMEKAWVLSYPLSAQRRLRLGGCPG